MLEIEIASAHVSIKLKNGKYKAGIKRMKMTVKKDVSAMSGMWQKHGKAIKGAGVAIAGIGAAVGTAFALMIKTTARFEQSMANTQSVIGGTADEMERLTDFARVMGKQSVFSASEAADAMYFLGSAGLRTDDIMNSLKGTLSLAAATQSDLAFTTSVVAANLSAFGLQAAEADRISNVFAATISASQATMTKLSTALGIIGPVARSVGMSLEDVSSILATLFNNGIDASTAGTALRGAIAALLKPSNEAVKILSRLNVAIVDTDGNMRDMVDIVRDLDAASMTTADALAIFGRRAGPAMLALTASGADGIEKLTREITGTNKAMEMAKVQTETFTGQVKLLKSAVEEAQISIGTRLLPTLTEWTTKLSRLIVDMADVFELSGLKGDVKDFESAMAQIGIQMQRYGSIADVAGMTLGELGVNIDDINDLLGTQFREATNAGFALTELSNAYDKLNSNYKSMWEAYREANLEAGKGRETVLPKPPEIFGPPEKLKAQADKAAGIVRKAFEFPGRGELWFLKTNEPTIYERIAPVREGSAFEKRIQAGRTALEEMAGVVADIQAIPAARLPLPSKEEIIDYEVGVSESLDRTVAKGKAGWKDYENERVAESKKASQKIVAQQRFTLERLKADWTEHTAGIQMVFVDMFTNMLTGAEVSWKKFAVNLKNTLMKELAKIAVEEIFRRLGSLYTNIRIGGSDVLGGVETQDPFAGLDWSGTSADPELAPRRLNAPAGPGINVIIPNADIQHMSPARAQRLIQQQLEPARRRLIKSGVIPPSM